MSIDDPITFSDGFFKKMYCKFASKFKVLIDFRPKNKYTLYLTAAQNEKAQI